MTEKCPVCLDDISEEEYNDHMKAHALTFEAEKEWEDIFRPEAWEPVEA